MKDSRITFWLQLELAICEIQLKDLGKINFKVPVQKFATKILFQVKIIYDLLQIKNAFLHV